MVVSSFQRDLKDITQEQSKVKDEDSLSPFAHQLKVHTHVFQYPFVSLLETSVKGDFVLSMDYGYQFQVEFEFPTLKFFFLFDENERRKQSSISHWIIDFT